jgi:molecular chaperone GrpE
MASDTDAQRTDADTSEAQSAATAGAPELEKLKLERDDLLAQLLRARADYQNLRRRTQLDIDNSVRRSMESLFQGLFLVVDNLDLALGAPHAGADARSLGEGIEMTRAQLLRALAQEHVEPTAVTKEFDPTLHEAVSTVESREHVPGSVVTTLRRGWTWRGQVLRPAQVQVACAPRAASGTEGA